MNIRTEIKFLVFSSEIFGSLRRSSVVFENLWQSSEIGNCRKMTEIFLIYQTK